MKPNQLFLIIAIAGSTVVSAQTNSTSQQFPTRSANLDLSECTVQLIQDIDLPALESGQIIAVDVKPGDSVTKDQAVAQMDDSRSQRALDEATLRHSIADRRANDATEEKTAYKRYRLAYIEHSKSAKLAQSRSVSEHDANRARFSAEVAQLEYEGAKKTRELAGIEAAAEMVTVRASEDSIARHRITSPIDGQIVDVKREAGEWVTAGETVMRIARMDRLRIPGIVNGNLYDPHEIADRPVTVTLELARGRQVQFTGEIVFAGVEKRIGNKFMVWAEVDNRPHAENSNHWMLQPGSVVDMRIHMDQAPVQSAFAGSGGSDGQIQK
jgi:multidrug efflux pump subunit AcrA (membrane-fusion protein)